MHYIINNVVRFNSDEYTLERIHDPHSAVILTATMSRLLYFLIRNQDVNVTRDDILSQVWEAYGLRTSNNSLNKYISDLRQVFRTLGLEEEVIVTIPKTGFSISKRVKITKESENENVDGNITEKKRGFSFEKYKVTSVIVILFLFIFFNFYLVHTRNGDNDDYTTTQETYPVGMIDDCPVIALKPITDILKPRNMEITRHILNKNGMHCEAESVFYIRFSDDVIYHNPGRVFLADCSIRNKNEGTLSSCYNYYDSGYDTDD